jgi:hypothetical protein
MQSIESKTVIETFLHFIQDWVFNRKICVAQRLKSLLAFMQRYIYNVKTIQTMKAIVTFTFIIFLSFSALAQEASKEVKIKTFTSEVELNIQLQQNQIPGKEVARLYMFKNSRVKKALNFKTKRNTSKIA